MLYTAAALQYILCTQPAHQATSELSHGIENLEANFKCISYSLRWVTISCIVESCICFQYLKKSINKSFKAFEKLISLDLYETYQCKNSLYPNRAGHINMYRGQSCTRCTGVGPFIFIYIFISFAKHTLENVQTRK